MDQFIEEFCADCPKCLKSDLARLRERNVFLEQELKYRSLTDAQFEPYMPGAPGPDAPASGEQEADFAELPFYSHDYRVPGIKVNWKRVRRLHDEIKKEQPCDTATKAEAPADLERCPDCGDITLVVAFSETPGIHGYWVECKFCGKRGSKGSNPSDARMLWNKENYPATLEPCPACGNKKPRDEYDHPERFGLFRYRYYCVCGVSGAWSDWSDKYNSYGEVDRAARAAWNGLCGKLPFLFGNIMDEEEGLTYEYIYDARVGKKYWNYPNVVADHRLGERVRELIKANRIQLRELRKSMVQVNVVWRPVFSESDLSKGATK